MSKNTSLILGDHFTDFIASQLQDGRYGSASEVVRQALRLLEEREQKLAALRLALIEGENSGKPKKLNRRMHLIPLHTIGSSGLQRTPPIRS